LTSIILKLSDSAHGLRVNLRDHISPPEFMDRVQTIGSGSPAGATVEWGGARPALVSPQRVTAAAEVVRCNMSPMEQYWVSIQSAGKA
jgi:hypothetical protein